MLQKETLLALMDAHLYSSLLENDIVATGPLLLPRSYCGRTVAMGLLTSACPLL
jgi:hypothetical protein